DVEVAVAQRRHPIGAVALDAQLGADAEVEVVNQADNDGQHALAREAIERDVFVGQAAQRRQRLAEELDLGVFFLLLPRRERRMIFVLDAPRGIDADGLQAAARRGRDADVLPGGRDHQLPYAFELCRVGDRAALVVFVPEAFLLRAAPPPPLGPRAVPDHLARALRRAGRRAIGRRVLYGNR